jgi:tRNA(fMet)-specific endonuclease VapC
VFVLDTNTVLDYFRGRGKVAERFLGVAPIEVAIPAVVVYEVWVGVLGSQNARRRQSEFEQFLAAVVVLPFDTEAARAAAELRRKLEQDGEGIGPIDTLIAATALAQRGTLVTRNVREFSRIEGLRVENWYD